MKHALGWIQVALLSASLLGCSSDEQDGSSGAGGRGSPTSSGPSSGAGGSADGCVKAGGVCGCAGGCQPGYHPAEGGLLDACPQPCDTCGGCSQECCLPDDDAGTDGGSACNGPCPPSLPATGDTCTGDASCGYGDEDCTCTQGLWQCTCCAQVDCPKSKPVSGTACTSSAARCGYYVDVTCSCAAGVWTCSC